MQTLRGGTPAAPEAYHARCLLLRGSWMPRLESGPGRRGAELQNAVRRSGSRWLLAASGAEFVGVSVAHVQKINRKAQACRELAEV